MSIYSIIVVCLIISLAVIVHSWMESYEDSAIDEGIERIEEVEIDVRSIPNDGMNLT